jgi:CubicO group peptidase (beta-lactamase class C family)
MLQALESADVATLPLAPKNPLPYRHQLRAVRSLIDGFQQLLDAGGPVSRLVLGPKLSPREDRRSRVPGGVQGAADPNFACAVRSFASLFPTRRLGGGALSVYLDGRPVVDVWTGWADRRGEVPWSANTGAMVFSATKGLASTVIHRLVDRGLLAYDVPVAEYWPEFGANGKSAITIRDVMRHRAGLSHLNGASGADLMDHQIMEARLAAAPAGWLLGKPAYHVLTYGWLMSGLARAVTGTGMRELIRVELAQPLNTDGLHLGRPPADAPTRTAQIMTPQGTRANPLFNFVAPKIAAFPLSAGFGAIYFPGMKAIVQGDIPMLDGEVPAANGVCTARALARVYTVRSPTAANSTEHSSCRPNW